MSYGLLPALSVFARFFILKDPVQTSFLFITVKHNGFRGDHMAKSHYSIKKRKRELARKQKQEEKRQRRLDKNSIKQEEALDEPEDKVENQLV